MHPKPAAALLGALLVLAAPAAADDPKDPAMRTAAARDRDRELTRRLNQAELAHVRERDAGYAVGGAATRDSAGRSAAREDHATRIRDHQQAVADYAHARANYASAMAHWRRQVAACQSGDWTACE